MSSVKQANKRRNQMVNILSFAGAMALEVNIELCPGRGKRSGSS